MEDKLETFFSENDFDFQEPNMGHQQRFEKKLNNREKYNKKPSWKFLSVAASLILILGFWLGSNHQKNQLELADVSPKMEEVQNYFVSTIKRELKNLEKNRSLDTETIIEAALEELEELESNYKLFIEELNYEGNTAKIVNSMIKNYQRRLQLLENVLQQIHQIKNAKLVNNEIYI
jgi:mevalonate kinase